ncbi:MAG: nucleoside-diphosphate kinase [Gemmatimonadota bacterium]|nr:MAG: nucleoside-diphosphate kinase [Gemmatimonadota bacterium]
MMQTLAILKPDAVESGLTGKILAHLEDTGFKIRAARLALLTEAEAKAFYKVHEERPFYRSLVAYMTSGPCMPLVLEREDAVVHLREVIGATDPSEAAEGTVRRLYAESKERNVIHASDSAENAVKEISFFFSASELERLWGKPTR